MPNRPSLKGFLPGGANADQVLAGQIRSPYQFFPAFPHLALDKWDCFDSSSFYSSTTDDAADYFHIAENSGTLTRDATGILLTTGGANGNDTCFQRCGMAAVTANKRQIAVARVSLDIVASGKFAFGFWPVNLDQATTNVNHSAIWAKATAGTGALTCVTKDGSSTTSATGFTATLATAYDLAVVINGTTNVQFFYKATTTETWTLAATNTANLPAATQQMRFGIGQAATTTQVQVCTVQYFSVAQER